jgi:hypothetical protein
MRPSTRCHVLHAKAWSQIAKQNVGLCVFERNVLFVKRVLWLGVASLLGRNIGSRFAKLLSALRKPNFLPRQLSCFVHLQIPYDCTCDQYDRSHRGEGITCDSLQTCGTRLLLERLVQSLSKRLCSRCNRRSALPYRRRTQSRDHATNSYFKDREMVRRSITLHVAPRAGDATLFGYYEILCFWQLRQPDVSEVPPFPRVVFETSRQHGVN